MKKQLIIMPLLIIVPACAGGGNDYTERMAGEHDGDEPVSNVSSENLQGANISTENVEYTETDGETISGYYAEPENASEDIPAIIVIHEWWGLNENIRTMTDQLAAEGYKALAVDLYSGEVTESSEEAQQLMQQAMEDPETAIENLDAAIDYLKGERSADRLGVIGWCFGGAWSLNISLASADEIDATVIYYGHLETDPAAISDLNHPVLGIFGEEDEGIPVEDAHEFEAALQEIGVEHEIHIYEGADHAFANPSGNNYNAEAAEDAWEKTTSFLDRTLKGE
ncbi:MAG: dienelactone hydrolase family protein [Balneolaceae bacterium]